MKLDMVTSQKEMNPTSIGKTKEENFVTGYENILAVEHSSKLWDLNQIAINYHTFSNPIRYQYVLLVEFSYNMLNTVSAKFSSKTNMRKPELKHRKCGFLVSSNKWLWTDKIVQTKLK